MDGDEGVVFEELGAGAITRLWMTMGDGASVPLDPSIRIRIYIDEAAAPVVDLPLPALFSGQSPPFLRPLVQDRTSSSGGNVSYVPIPYRQGCRVSLLGADDKKVWFQFSFQRLASPEGVTSFTGHEDLGRWSALLASPGRDPWPPAPSSSVTSGHLSLGPGESATLMELSGPDSITALRFTLPPAAWPQVQLLAEFDDEASVHLSLSDFFAMGAVGPKPTRSLLVGLDKDGVLYSYFPMPFFGSGRVGLRSLAGPQGAPVGVSWSIRTSGTPPAPQSGRFGASLHATAATTPGADFTLLDLTGEGRLVGLFLELGAVDPPDASYFEGDERVFVDGSAHPQLYGTGVEDLFNGGFGFDLGPFGLALHGSPYRMQGDGILTAAYRLMLSDPVPFASRIHAGLESGPLGNITMRARAVAYFYRRAGVGLVERDVLQAGDATSRQEHCYSAEGPWTVKRVGGAFEGEPPVGLKAAVLSRSPGAASFVLRGAVGPRLRLRRRFDAGTPASRADVFLDGRLVGAFPPSEANPWRRWRETDLDIPVGEGDLALSVVAAPDPAGGPGIFTEASYELWSSPGLPPPPSACPGTDP